MIRCQRCLGTKKMRGMGGMKHECTECNGKGYVQTVVNKPLHVANTVPVGTKTDLAHIKDNPDDSGQLVPAKRKPGRKPGYRPKVVEHINLI